MKDDEKISGALQENLLSLLVFDDKHAKLIRSAVTPRLFESAVFREVAGHAIDFIDQFGGAIKEHISDSMEHLLNDENPRKAESYKRLLENLFMAKDSVNAEYTISQLHKFVRQQNIKSAIVKATEAIEDGRVDEAEVEMQKGLNTQINVFERGSSLREAAANPTFLGDDASAAFMTGIEALDEKGIGPERGTQLLFVAPAKKGKTWFAVQCGKMALLQRLSVVHITLEMSETKMLQRYMQAIFSISKKDAIQKLPRMRRGEDGRLDDVFFEEVERLSFDDPNIRKKLTSRGAKFFNKKRDLIIKQFPTSTLTITELEAYLDGLERFHKIVPDLVIIDYPKLMKLDVANLRTSLGATHEQLRGVAVKRNHAQIVLGQSNREGAKSKVVDETHVGEDFSLIQTADVALTYSQTEAEKKLGLARLLTAAVRGEQSGDMILMTQAYGVGQFCLDSCVLGGGYWDFIGNNGSRPQERDDD